MNTENRLVAAMAGAEGGEIGEGEKIVRMFDILISVMIT